MGQTAPHTQGGDSMMRKTGLMIAFIAGFAAPALADPVEGIWKTQPGDEGSFAHVRIEPCGQKICGYIHRTFDASGKEAKSDNIGKRMIWDMTPRGNGAYAGGKIWAPDRDKTYKSKMQLSGNNLKVSGCVLGGMICRGQTWTRVQ